jgi:hypothetical protein
VVEVLVADGRVMVVGEAALAAGAGQEAVRAIESRMANALAATNSGVEAAQLDSSTATKPRPRSEI